MGIVSKIFGSYSARELKKINPIVDKIESLADEYSKLSDTELQGKTEIFKERYKNGETLDDLLPEAFAAVREAAKRVLGMFPFRVQLIGGVVLHQGRIAEMKTGEGKTLVAVLPSYLNALTGEGVHIVTVNDYLARRDSEWMGKIHRFMGLTVGLIVHGLTKDEKQKAYNSDITYGTNNELGFDYLRDNMALYESRMVQRGHSFAIVDEVDSILIDEARTPLIISGAGDKGTDLYRQANEFVKRLKSITYTSVDEKQEESEELDADYIIDEKAKTATLTSRGVKKAEASFNVENWADLDNSTLSHHINQAIKAHGTMKRDIDYVVKDGEVVIVDEFTGRLMVGRRYSEGLHQAIEAKEGTDVQSESKTLATITFQNFFRLYGKLSGMTGTALTEQEEFMAIYNLDIIEIPTNKPIARIDKTDLIFRNDNGKYKAVVEKVRECSQKGQPVLVGTVSVEKSELYSDMLRRAGIKHNVLNAKNHEKEAEIIAQAGKLGSVTIATNMAGRGTDIMLGGNAEYLAKTDLKKRGVGEDAINEVTGYGETSDEAILKAREIYAERYAYYKDIIAEEAKKVREVGGLYIIGTERHDSRRIDNQLRGRAGRQGDKGETCFYLAMTDDTMRLFGSERVMGMMDKLGVEEDVPFDNKIISNAIEQAQKTVESRNFQSRKSVIEYDDVMNIQRKVIYEQRRKALAGEDLGEYIAKMVEDFIMSSISDVMAGQDYFNDKEQFEECLRPFYSLFLRKDDITVDRQELEAMNPHDLQEKIMEKAKEVYALREEGFGELPDGKLVIRELERIVMLRVVDEYWMDHLDSMQELRRGVSLRAYGNTNPVDAYKKEGFDMFEAMINGIRSEVVRRMYQVQIKKEQTLERKSVVKGSVNNVGGDASAKKQPKRAMKKIGRNDPCPCGKLRPNGLPMKYKDCCGREE